MVAEQVNEGAWRVDVYITDGPEFSFYCNDKESAEHSVAVLFKKGRVRLAQSHYYPMHRVHLIEIVEVKKGTDDGA